MALPKLKSTKYKGILYHIKDGRKIYYGRFRVDGKLYIRKLESNLRASPLNDRTAFMQKEKYIEDIKKGKDIKGNKIDDLWDDFLKLNENYLSESNKRNKVSIYNKHFKESIGKMEVSRITHSHIQKIANELLESHKPKTVKNIMSHLKNFFNHCIISKYIDENPADNIKIPKFDNRRDYPLTVEESKRLYKEITKIEDLNYRGIFIFLVSGRRLNEVLQLEWKNIDLDNNIYRLPFDKNKSKTNLDFVLTSKQKKILLEIEHREGYVFKNPKTDDRYKDIRKIWSRLKEKAEIEKDLRIHDLRHLIGSLGVNELGLNLEHIGAILGHTDDKVTKIYSKVKKETAHTALEKILDYLE